MHQDNHLIFLLCRNDIAYNFGGGHTLALRVTAVYIPIEHLVPGLCHKVKVSFVKMAVSSPGSPNERCSRTGDFPKHLFGSFDLLPKVSKTII
ncbi:hypothetical protein D3C76_1660170 [compost metagenome]